MATYTPKPIDVRDVPIPPELLPLIERLAESVHESWAKQRMDKGWTYGPERDDDEQKHPSLIPYDQLSESEKEVDRATVRQTIQALIKLGARIEVD